MDGVALLIVALALLLAAIWYDRHLAARDEDQAQVDRICRRIDEQGRRRVG